MTKKYSNCDGADHGLRLIGLEMNNSALVHSIRKDPHLLRQGILYIGIFFGSQGQGYDIL